VSGLRRLWREEAGYSLVELIVVSAIAPILLAATLLVFTEFSKNTTRNQVAAEAQANTRQQIDQLARELRNLASPTPEQPQAIDSAAAYDIVFQTVGPSDFPNGQNASNVRRVRYCLDNPGAGLDATLWSQVQTWTTANIPSAPSTSSCPSAAWGNQRVAAQGITNRNQSRPLFVYNAAIKTSITAVTFQVWARVKSEKEPKQGVLRSQVFLRNQNQAPLASFTATSIGNGHVLLNGSASADPDGDDLVYQWTATPCSGTCSWTGLTVDATTGQGVKTIELTVTDGAGLIGETSQEVDVG
jgi:prepilin-type N-terminal cleavage/methylation domain-containing protein